MTLKERWNAEENKLGKILKYIIGYAGMAGGAIMDMSVNYMPFIKDYIPESVTHWIFTVGLVSYGIGKLTVKNA